MGIRRILVVGYPKSGNTWVTRLTAELLSAPVRGFWRAPSSIEIAVEGTSRSSDVEVFKGHQRLDDVRADFELRNIVYVVRDVRDVIVSGAHYFSFRSRTVAGRLRRLARWLWPLPPAADARRRMTRMLMTAADGDRRVSRWCAVPWDAHVAEYLRAGAFVLRYEDMLRSPEIECRRLLQHLGVPRSSDAIRAAIARHTFAATKRRFATNGDRHGAEFLREGGAGGWTTALTLEQSAFCNDRFAAMLERLDYLDAPGTLLDGTWVVREPALYVPERSFLRTLKPPPAERAHLRRGGPTV